MVIDTGTALWKDTGRYEHISSNRCRPRIVAEQLEALNKMNAAFDWYMRHTHMYANNFRQRLVDQHYGCLYCTNHFHR